VTRSGPPWRTAAADGVGGAGSGSGAGFGGGATGRIGSRPSVSSAGLRFVTIGDSLGGRARLAPPPPPGVTVSKLAAQSEAADQARLRGLVGGVERLGGADEGLELPGRRHLDVGAGVEAAPDLQGRGGIEG